jgi:hypothetical protein
MKIIFLDIDGVLNSTQFAERHYNETGKGLFMYDFIDPDAVNEMRDFLLKHQDTRLVIVSSWRYGNVHETIDFFKTNGMKPLVEFIVGDTPRSLSGERGKEIKWFIENINTDKIGDLVIEPFDIDRYVFVDDEDFDYLNEQLPFHIKIDGFYGITNNDFKNIERKLYGQL